MNRKNLTLGTLAAAVLCLDLASCSQDAPAATSTQAGDATATVAEPQPAPATELSAPDERRILARSTERWDHIAHQDWIQAYDFLAPERKEVEKLSRFLEGKEDHDYRDPSKPRLIAVEDDKGYVAFEVVWTPLHPEIMGADNVPPEGMTEVLGLVETWGWQDGEWYWLEVKRRSDFFREHPELLQEEHAPDAGGTKPHTAGTSEGEGK